MTKKKEEEQEKEVELPVDVEPVEEVQKQEEVPKQKKVQLYRLSREGTQITDRGWTLRSGEEKELPEVVTSAIRNRIAAGFIVKVE